MRSLQPSRRVPLLSLSSQTAGRTPRIGWGVASSVISTRTRTSSRSRAGPLPRAPATRSTVIVTVMPSCVALWTSGSASSPRALWLAATMAKRAMVSLRIDQGCGGCGGGGCGSGCSAAGCSGGFTSLRNMFVGAVDLTGLGAAAEVAACSCFGSPVVGMNFFIVSEPHEPIGLQLAVQLDWTKIGGLSCSGLTSDVVDHSPVFWLTLTIWMRWSGLGSVPLQIATLLATLPLPVLAVTVPLTPAGKRLSEPSV